MDCNEVRPYGSTGHKAPVDLTCTLGQACLPRAGEAGPSRRADVWGQVQIAGLARIVRPGGGIVVTQFNSDLALPQVEVRGFDRMRRITGYLEWCTSAVSENCHYAIPGKPEEQWSEHLTVLELRRHTKLQDHLVLRKPWWR